MYKHNLSETDIDSAEQYFVRYLIKHNYNISKRVYLIDIFYVN